MKRRIFVTPVVMSTLATAMLGLGGQAEGHTTTELAPVSAKTEPTPLKIAQGKTIKPEAWALPVKGYRLTGRFGNSSGLWASTHTGLDFAVASGTPIHAIADGVVVSAESDGAFGNKTVIRLIDGTEVWFCHQTEFKVSPGDQLQRGQVIGTVGSTGNSTGPHLHLEIHPQGGDPVDPEIALAGHRVKA